MLEDSSLRGEKKNQFVLRVFAFRLSPLFLTKRKVTLKLPPSYSKRSINITQAHAPCTISNILYFPVHLIPSDKNKQQNI